AAADSAPLRRAEALRGVVDEEGTVRAGDLLLRDEIARQTVQAGRNDAERPAEIEPLERAEIQVERRGIDIAQPDGEPGARHGGRHRKARVRRDHYLATVRALLQGPEEDRQGGATGGDEERVLHAQARADQLCERRPLSRGREDGRQHTPHRQRGTGGRDQPKSAHGMFLTMRGPITRVTGTGNAFQARMSRAYFTFFGLTSTPGRPSRGHTDQYKGQGWAPPCSLNRNGPLSGVDRPKSNVVNPSRHA